MCDITDDPVSYIIAYASYRLGENMDAIVKEARELVK
jgi:hypothetical protein